MTKQKILVAGKNGQLGNELVKLSLQFPNIEFLFTDLAELDITDFPSCQRLFNDFRPDCCINAAAYTAVDKAETDQETAFKINALGAGNLAQNCLQHNARFIHVSTDYVFNGNGTAPYTEDHVCDPVNFYGYSKLKGEQLALENPLSVVIRTSWVYSFFGNNFVKTMIRLMQQKEAIGVVSDQFGSPTYAADLANAIMVIATAADFQPGVFHFSNDGEISWFEFASAIRDLSGFPCNVRAITTPEFPTPAKRPAYSVLDKKKIVSTYPVGLRPWKESLYECLSLIDTSLINSPSNR